MVTDRTPHPVELRDVTVDYHFGAGRLTGRGIGVRAVDGVSLTIKRGQTLGLVGGTGAGKTTIAKLLMGRVEPTSGQVLVDGRPPSRDGRQGVARRIQIVPQDPYSSLDPRMRIMDIISEPLTVGKFRLRRSAAVSDRVDEMLALVGLPLSKRASYPHQFSGGQRQRVAIARALAPAPPIVILDEPTSALDVSVRAQILTLLKSLQERMSVTYLVISHDLLSIAYLSSEVAVMYSGQIVESGPAESIYWSAKHPYTQRLLASVPTLSEDFLSTVPARVETGERKGVEVGTAACHYYQRCALRASLGSPRRCREERPPLQPVASGQCVACHFRTD